MNDLKKVLLAGIGMTAMTVENADSYVKELDENGRLTVEEGKELEQELKRQSKEEAQEFLAKLDAKKSISHNIDGMEVTYYSANGEKGGTVTFDSSMIYAGMPWYAMYSASNVDEYGNFVSILVRDEGNYKFTVSFDIFDEGITYTAKSASNPNPSIKPVSTEDTPAKPAKPSGNISSATSDVATKDNAGNNNSTNGTANNGVVATGDFATPAIFATVMILAAAVMFVLKRKHSF